VASLRKIRAQRERRRRLMKGMSVRRTAIASKTSRGDFAECRRINVSCGLQRLFPEPPRTPLDIRAKGEDEAVVILATKGVCATRANEWSRV
jgi:hypothetical protein